MFEHHFIRSFTLALCVALLAGCGGGSETSGSSSAAASAVGSTQTATAPVEPQNLSATAGNAQASLTWSASSGATSYVVKRSTTSGGPFAQLASVTSPSYTDAAVSNGTTYYYVVDAVNSEGDSVNSLQAAVTPDPTITTPSIPLGLTANAGNAVVNLTWTANSGAASYNVKRATTSGGPYTQLSSVTSASYADTKASNGTTYYYVVSAVDSSGESANSAQISATAAATTAIPAVPTGLAATAGDEQATLNWTASNGATSYHVKRATTSGGPYSQVAAPASPPYTDTMLADGTPYYYVVSAVSSAGESANSAPVTAHPVAPVSNPPPTTFGTWTNITPAGVDLTDALDCGNYGTQSVQVDSTNPSTVYTQFMCQGIWKSTDYGVTWTGPINTGANGATVRDCAGGITVSGNGAGTPPTIYESCIRGNALGFWKSVNGGVDWTTYNVAPLPTQDCYPPVVDPNNANHLLMAAHERDILVQSTDGGHTWSNVPLAGGMLENGGTGAIFFVNTGTASTTAQTWLWMAQESGGLYGTWRTANGGASWVQVDKNEHPHGSSQMYQPDTSGIVFITGTYSALGDGVLRSTDYGQTWTHVGLSDNSRTLVWGTPNNLYAIYGYPIGIGQSTNAAFELGAQPGAGTWVEPGTPSGLTQAGAQVGVVNDGTHYIFIGAMWNAGLWRYVEP